MKRTRHYEAFELLQQSEQVRPLLITEAHLLGLPEPVQRYLRYAQVIGKETIRAVRLKQKGFMRLQPGQKWLPMVAEQYFTTNPPRVSLAWHYQALSAYLDVRHGSVFRWSWQHAHTTLLFHHTG
jgi:hypothetical protein